MKQLRGQTVGNRRQIWDYRLLVKKGTCAFCRSSRIQKAANRSDGLTVWECKDCGLAFVDPRPSPRQLRDYYDSGYFLGEKSFFAGQDYCEMRDRAIADKTVTGYPEIVSNLEIRGKAILEIGCGSGALLKLLKEHLPSKMIGIDWAKHPIAYGQSRYGLELCCGTLEEAHLGDETFDLIIMIDFIEHVENLPSFLQEVVRILRPQGRLFLLTPNYRAFSRAKSSWTCLYKDFEHLQYFSPNSLKTISESMKLTLIQWWTRGLPVPLSPYPRLYNRGFHRLFYPGVSWDNLGRKVKYTPWPFLGKDFGHDLLAVVQR